MNRGDMNKSKMKFNCPRCGDIIKLPIWGCGWYYDHGKCDKCNYDGELDTMTGTDPDGTEWQIKKDDGEDK